MHKIIQFKKEITFNNTIEEIISISMDDKLEIEDLKVKGDFVVEGEYLNATKKESFHFEIPYLGYLEDNYDTKSAVVKVDDFYYEIIEPNKLGLFIDILVDKLEEKPLIEENIEMFNEVEDRLVEEEKKEIVEDKTESRDNIIFKDDYTEAYMTYRIYIVRDGDTVDSILEKYDITIEELTKYNVVNELNIGDKLIIPNEKNQ